jgi:uncharacterized protein
MKSVVVALVLLCAGAIEQAEIPPAPTRFVTDRAGVLSDRARAALESRLEAYERSTGHQVVVWIGESIGAGRSLEEWSARVFEAWGVGRRGQDDGAVLFVLMSDRKARIEVGYGLEGSLTDARAGRILDEALIPAMRAGQPESGIVRAIGAMLGTIGGEVGQPQSDVAPPYEEPEPSPFRNVLSLIFLAFIVLILFRNPWAALFFLSSFGRHDHGGGGGFGGGFSGGGGRSGGGGASRSW